MPLSERRELTQRLVRPVEGLQQHVPVRTFIAPSGGEQLIESTAGLIQTGHFRKRIERMQHARQMDRSIPSNRAPVSSRRNSRGTAPGRRRPGAGQAGDATAVFFNAWTGAPGGASSSGLRLELDRMRASHAMRDAVEGDFLMRPPRVANGSRSRSSKWL